MRIVYLTLFILTLLFSTTNAQVVGGYNKKLAKLFSSGKYESCLFKADNLTYKKNTSRDPEPYLYISMCFLELSKSDDPMIQEDYKDGVKQAIRYAGKFIKKDKDGEMYSENIEFVNDLKKMQYTLVKTNFDEEEYSKAASAAKKYSKLNREEDYTVLYFIGVCELLSNKLSQGTNDIETAKTQLKELTKSGTVKIDKIFNPLISKVFSKYSESLIVENK
ncbi:MAG: hypothetical protein PF517_12010 [Salinivirgaceae bacterium]|jgi:hypothetical protein|nr:hypothetical protein [Salinivirgaceae bacterium]